jgi:superfamily I DNA/RNA helicase
MSSRHLLDKALEEMAENPEQLAAVHAKGHCVVLAGPGSGKTKTLTAAMARTLLHCTPAPPAFRR